MFGTALCIATVVLGIEIGWEPDSDGDLEYIIQIEPELASQMFEGRPIRYTVRPEHQGVRHFRFQVGTEELPREGTLPTPPSAVDPDETAEKSLASPPGPELAGPPALATSPEPPTTEPVVAPDKESAPVSSPHLAGPWAHEFSPKPTSPSSNARTDVSADSPNVAPPDVLPVDLTAKKIDAQTALHVAETEGKPEHAVTEPDTAAQNALKTPLILASCLAVGFFAAFAYLLWVHVGTRTRYRQLLHEYYAAVGSMPGGRSLEAAGLSPSM